MSARPQPPSQARRPRSDSGEDCVFAAACRRGGTGSRCEVTFSPRGGRAAAPTLADRLPNNLNFSVAGVDGEALMSSLKEIAVSSGSACSTAEPEPSHVLRAMGVSESLSRASLRFGLSRYTTEAEIDVAVAEVVKVVRRLRA